MIYIKLLCFFIFGCFLFFSSPGAIAGSSAVSAEKQMRMLKQLDQLDQLDHLDFIEAEEKARACIRVRDFACAEHKITKAEKYARSASDKKILLLARESLTVEVASVERERLAKELADEREQKRQERDEQRQLEREAQDRADSLYAAKQQAHADILASIGHAGASVSQYIAQSGQDVMSAHAQARQARADIQEREDQRQYAREQAQEREAALAHQEQEIIDQDRRAAQNHLDESRQQALNAASKSNGATSAQKLLLSSGASSASSFDSGASQAGYDKVARERQAREDEKNASLDVVAMRMNPKLQATCEPRKRKTSRILPAGGKTKAEAMQGVEDHLRNIVQLPCELNQNAVLNKLISRGEMVCDMKNGFWLCYMDAVIDYYINPRVDGLPASGVGK